MKQAGWDVNYPGLLSKAKKAGVKDLPAYLADTLPGEWCDVYFRRFQGAEIVEVAEGQYFYLFDISRDRIVAAYGTSGTRTGGPKRHDQSRRKVWAGGSITRYHKVPVDKGHLMSDASGGGSDINLFVQRRDLNQGHSQQGKRYRKLERLCQANPGTFCFARALYSGEIANPEGLEFGVLRDPHQFWLDVEAFDNALA